MKTRNILLILTTALVLSCSDDESKTADLKTPVEEPLRLELIGMSGQMRNSETTGEEMQWQEYFLLKKQMNFEKVHLEDGAEVKSTGTFEIEMINGDKYLKFTHDTKNKAYGNCTGDKVELLRYTNSNELKGSWSACDGPGLFYKFQN